MNLPEWALNAMKEAGVSAEGWESKRVEIPGKSDHEWLDNSAMIPGKRLTVSGPPWAGDLELAQEDGDSVDFHTGSIPDAFRLAARLAAALENKPCERCGVLEATVKDLLARIHRDGGHYTAEHGIAKSVDDAHTKVADAYGRLGGLEAENDKLQADLRYWKEREAAKTWPYVKRILAERKAALTPDADAKGGEEGKA